MNKNFAKVLKELSQEKAFTLMESLLALVVLSIVTLPFMNIINESLLLGESSKIATQVHCASSGRMDFLTGLKYEDLKKVIPGRQSWEKIECSFYEQEILEGVEFYEYLEVIDYEQDKSDDIGMKKLLLIKIKATWHENGESEEYVLKTIRAFDI